MKSYTIVGWTYEAGIHCNNCAKERFAVSRVSDSGVELIGTDREGNSISPIFADSEFDYIPHCEDCSELINASVIEEESRE